MALPIAGGLAVTLSGSPAEAPALRSITSRLDGTLSSLRIEASDPVAYLTSQPDPLTVLVDLRNVSATALAPSPVSYPVAPIAGVSLERAVAPDGAPVSRVRIRLDRAAPHRVRASRNFIFVDVDRAGPPTDASAPGTFAPSHPRTFAPATFKPSDPGTPAPAPAPSTSAPRTLAPASGAASGSATELRSVQLLSASNGLAVMLSGNGRLVASSVDATKDLPHRVFLDFRGVAAGHVPAVTAVGAGGIERVRVAVNSRQPLITRVVIDLARKLPYTVETVGNDLRVLFSKVVDAAATAAPAAATPPAAPTPVSKPVVASMTMSPAKQPSAAASPAPAVAASPTPALSPAPSSILLAEPAVVSSGPLEVALPPRATDVAAAPAPASPAAFGGMSVLLASPQQQAATAPSRFTGHPVTLDFQGADLRAVLRTFAEISGLNIVIDPSINGSVDVSLREVPWDQALDIILKANKLGYSVDGTIVRIVPLTVLAQETEEQRKLSDSQALAGELRVLTRPLSYAKAADLVPIITRSALSTRGDVQIDTRTNTLIIRDLADRLVGAADLISTLDKPQPQVEIEARIVQTTREFARNLGVEWGFNGRMTPALGNTTPLAFPNQIVAGGLAGSPGSGTAVRLPAANPSSAVGIALGSINGALNLDLALSALEKSGKGRFLSTPRVSTQNNVEAEITQGTQIPIQTVSNNTVTVSFKDAALTLKVTPQITSVNTVILRIFVENAAADFSKAVGTSQIPPINTQRAVTSVLVSDGETTVIGGIYVSSQTNNDGRTPALHRIPLLGWLFRNSALSDSNTELLIFITPRISK